MHWPIFTTVLVFVRSRNGAKLSFCHASIVPTDIRVQSTADLFIEAARRLLMLCINYYTNLLTYAMTSTALYEKFVKKLC